LFIHELSWILDKYALYQSLVYTIFDAEYIRLMGADAGGATICVLL